MTFLHPLLASSIFLYLTPFPFSIKEDDDCSVKNLVAHPVGKGRIKEEVRDNREKKARSSPQRSKLVRGEGSQ
jgi:hypothetical protein